MEGVKRPPSTEKEGSDVMQMVIMEAMEEENCSLTEVLTKSFHSRKVQITGDAMAKKLVQLFKQASPSYSNVPLHSNPQLNPKLKKGGKWF
mmetsp:Transcript_266/g.864  ORF Transcript_266/g.864 Transcript_266/m.864 type:complete len:91 (-) Transcript_266:174-446(-)